MSDNTTAVDNQTDAMSAEQQKVLYLEDLLQRQIEKLRKYDMDGALALAEQTGAVAGSLSAAGVLDRPEMADSRRRIQGLYRELSLIIASERQEVAGKLSQIREGLKALSGYGGK